MPDEEIQADYPSEENVLNVQYGPMEHQRALIWVDAERQKILLLVEGVGHNAVSNTLSETAALSCGIVLSETKARDFGQRLIDAADRLS